MFCLTPGVMRERHWVSKSWLRCSLLATAWLIRTSAAAGCDCEEASPGWHFERSDVVVTGTVTRIEPIPSSCTGPYPAAEGEADGKPLYLCSERVTLSVTRVFKGSPRTVITVLNPDSAAGCGAFLQLNESYLLFAHADNPRQFSTSSCDGTRQLADSKAQIEQLTKLSNARGCHCSIERNAKVGAPVVFATAAVLALAGLRRRRTRFAVPGGVLGRRAPPA